MAQPDQNQQNMPIRFSEEGNDFLSHVRRYLVAEGKMNLREEVAARLLEEVWPEWVTEGEQGGSHDKGAGLEPAKRSSKLMQKVWDLCVDSCANDSACVTMGNGNLESIVASGEFAGMYAVADVQTIPEAFFVLFDGILKSYGLVEFPSSIVNPSQEGESSSTRGGWLKARGANNQLCKKKYLYRWKGSCRPSVRLPAGSHGVSESGNDEEKEQGEDIIVFIDMKAVMMGYTLVIHTVVYSSPAGAVEVNDEAPFLRELFYCPELVVKTSDYVRGDVRLRDGPGAGLYMMLGKFQREIMNHLCYKMDFEISRNVAGTVDLKFLENIMPEVKNKILKYLEVSDLCQLAQTSRRMKEACYQNSLWKCLAERDFKDEICPAQSEVWRLVYKRLYLTRAQKKRKAQEQQQKPVYRPHLPGAFPLPGSRDPRSGRRPPSGPGTGIIGGRYDMGPFTSFYPPQG
eukprot:Nk52_evm7s2635 gene=Nk52_evmTU7s2635